MATTAAPRLLRTWAAGLGTLLLTSVSWTWPQAGAQEPVTTAKLDLDAAIRLGLERQPALAAARASLAAAYSGNQAVSNLPRTARVVSRDIPIRLQQSCLGVTIAAAGLEQAEWETRYAVRRTYYSVQYARLQYAVVKDAVSQIEDAYKKAKELVDAGDPKIKVTTIDRDNLKIAKAVLSMKEAEARIGIEKAKAALREALGVGLDFPLDVVVEPLPPLAPAPNKDELIGQALAKRAELQQALAMNQVTELEITAQSRTWFRLESKTFAAGGDIHARPIPQGVANGEYRPGAIGPEMPPFLFGNRTDRVQRASDFNDRAIAVVNKTENLIALEVEANYLKWLEAAQNVQNLTPLPKEARSVAERVKERFDMGNASGEEYLRARTQVNQLEALLNQWSFEHALALAALERVTAGGYHPPAAK
ncbi:MAG: TolC family protein [Gemmataceae bacterium]|nr:TolC family protein [Gemmataceae bacterium]